jgi:hypothetical protein
LTGGSESGVASLPMTAVRDGKCLGFGWAAFVAGLLPVLAQDPLPAPQPRVQEVYAFSAKSLSRWEVSDGGPVVAALFEREGKWIEGMTYWTQPGGAIFSAGWELDWRDHIVMRGDTMFVGRAERVVRRPLTAGGTSSSVGHPWYWDFLAASDHEAVLSRGSYPVEGGHLGFMSLDAPHIVRGVDPGMYVIDLVARENDFVLHGSTKQGHVFARMEQPPYRPGVVVKAKVSRVKAKPETVRHFGSRFALFEQDRAFYLLAWGEKGADSIQRIPVLTKDLPILGVTETDEAVYVTRGQRDLLRITPGEKEAKHTMVPLPAGLGIDSIRGGKEDELFVLPPLKTSIVRLDTTPVSQVDVSPVTARETDGVMRFKVALEPASPVPVTFSYETRPRGATPDDDYTPVAGTAVLAPGATEAFVEVPLIDDLTIERAESFELHLTGISGALCDRAVATGRILGSGGPRKVGTTSKPGSQQEFERSMVSNLTFPEGVAEASRLGYVGFVPITPNSGPYFYASGWTLENAEKGWSGGKICQFDAVTGELLEEFDGTWFWNVTGNEVLVRTGNSLENVVRKEFFDGFPVLDFSEQTLAEGGGPQEIVARSERTSKAIQCEIVTADPLLGVTGISMDGGGRFRLQASPPDDGAVKFDRIFEVEVRLTDLESGATSTQWIPVTMSDDDYLVTQQFRLDGQERVRTLAADGDRLLAGYSRAVNAFHVADGTLVQESRTTMPEDIFMAGTLELEGSRVAFSTRSQKKQQNGIRLSGVERGVKGWKSKSTERPTAMAFAGRYLAVGEGRTAGGAPGRVRILDAAKGKEVRVIEAPDGSPGFGYDLAFSAGTLWVASPPAGLPFGKVHGYSVTDFSKVYEITGPEPEAAGIFAMSIAADDDQLVVGEPRGHNGIVWVFDPASGALLNKLGSLANQPVPMLGAQVATRNGRILATGGTSVPGLAPSPASVSTKVSTSSVIIINPPVGGLALPVALWKNRASSPRYLHPQGRFPHFFGGDDRIALLENAAVYSYAGVEGVVVQGLEVYFFPEPAAANSATVAWAPRATAMPLWPQPGAPEPRWSFRRTESGGLEAEVNVGADVAPGALPQVEWSDDLKVWYPMTEGAESVGGLLRIPLPVGAKPRGFLRLRSSGDE